MNHPKLSVQLYTVREAIQEDLNGTLTRIAGIGFEQVEPYNFADTEGLGAALTAAGLTAPTGHAHFLGESEDEQRRVFAAAKDLGIALAIDPHVADEKWQTADDVREIARQVNEAAKVASECGVAVGYHNHDHEFASRIEGTSAFEFFAGLLDAPVQLEVDTYWVATGGDDPVAVLGRLGDKVTAIHVKDGPATPEPKDQVPVGSGSLPIADILAAAPNALRVVELDDSATDRFDAVAQSFEFLTKEGLV